MRVRIFELLVGGFHGKHAQQCGTGATSQHCSRIKEKHVKHERLKFM
jgi:hypothetical protein